MGVSDGETVKKDGFTFPALFVQSATFQKLYQHLKSDNYIQGFIAQLKPFGSNEIVTVSLSMRRALEGEQADWVGAAQDVTDKYQKEARLKQLQEERTQSLRQLVMGVAHEMNTPLGNIRMAESFLSEQAEDFSQTERDICSDTLTHIDHGVDRLKELTQLMKDSVVVDRDYGQSEVNINQWLAIWCANTREAFPDLTLEQQDSGPETNWNTYPEALQKIMQQLVTNSINHNPELVQQQKLKACVGVSVTPGEITMHYRDNGKGIDPEQQQSIFLPFYTTQRQSASSKGLGLYQTYNLITALMQGYIQWSEDPEGFDIVMIFPKD